MGRVKPREAHGRPGWPVAAALAVGVLLLAGGLWWSQSSTSAQPVPGFTPQAGGPRLAVDRDLIDLGVQPLNRTATAIFRVSNVGSSPLQILGEPAVELVQGC